MKHTTQTKEKMTDVPEKIWQVTWSSVVERQHIPGKYQQHLSTIQLQCHLRLLIVQSLYFGQLLNSDNSYA